jgi:vanillate O-demethylase monooxygenase subunit
VVIDHWWAHPDAPKRRALVCYRVHQFFVPVDDGETIVFTYAFAIAHTPLPWGGGVGLFRRLVMRKMQQELDLDVWLCANLADKNPNIEGMKLSRFDRALGLNRERMKKIYFGV